MKIQVFPKSYRRGAVVALLALAGACPMLQAEIRPNPLFSNGAILQQGKPVPVWGTAAPGERLKVAFAGQSKTAVAGADGAWKVTLDPLAASSEPAVLSVAGSETVTVKNVLVGEVWLCSGQSNMRFNLVGSENSAGKIAAANLPTIRQFAVQDAISATPTNELVGFWDICSSATAPRFTAVGYSNGFEVSADGSTFHAAQARVAGNAVVVSAEAVKAPVAVRYAWHNTPPCSLYNAVGLPAPPFRVTIK